jgi:hypothetical protein
MIKLDQAVKGAMDFLERSGIHLPALEEVSLRDERWVVILNGYKLFGSEFRLERYIVELDSETGDIVGFRKEQPET